MLYFWVAVVFLFGSAVGSFVMVIAGRYNTGLPFLKGRSVCFSCNTELQNKDLIPIFSFLFLKGKCRSCSSKIPKSALTAEILMGLLSVVAAFKSGLLVFESNFQFSISNFQSISNESIFHFLILTAIFATLLLITIYDLKHFIIPDSFLVFFFIFSLLSIILNTYPIIHSFISGLILSIPFLLIFLISRGTWFGFGDVKYIAAIGFFLGFVQGLSAVVLSFWIGAVFSLGFIILKKIMPRFNLPMFKNNLTIKSEIPFGPFLSLGTILSFCLNLDLFQIYGLLS